MALLKRLIPSNWFGDHSDPITTNLEATEEKSTQKTSIEENDNSNQQQEQVDRLRRMDTK